MSIIGRSGAAHLSTVPRFLAILLSAGAMLAACHAPWDAPPPLPSPPVTLVYLDPSRSTDNPEAKAALLRNLEVVLDTVAAEHGRLIAGVIDANPLAHAKVVTDQTFTAPEAGGNPLVEHETLCQRSSAARTTMVGVVNGTRPAGPTDVFGALTSAGQRLRAFPAQARRRVVFLSDMVSTLPGRNLTGFTWTGAPSHG